MTHRNTILLLATLLLGFGVGWWLGSRKGTTEIVREEVRYVERPATRVDTELFPAWVAERIELPRLQYTDTIREEVCIPADTAGIINDYFKRREYELDFSTDSTGIYKVQAVVYCNRLESASATITPLQREIVTTIKEVRKFRPYIGGSVALGAKAGASLEVGALLKDHHLPRVGFQRLGKDNYLTIGYGYTF